MTSVRLDPQLEARLARVARMTGQPVSAIIRECVRKRCDDVLGQRLDLRLADVIGSVASGGGNSRRTGREFAKLLKKRGRRES